MKKAMFDRAISQPKVRDLWNADFDMQKWKDAEYYLLKNSSLWEDARKPKQKAKQPYRLIYVAVGLAATVCVFAFSPQARAFAEKIVWQINEWFNPSTNISTIEYNNQMNMGQYAENNMPLPKKYNSFADISIDINKFISLIDGENYFYFAEINDAGILEINYKYNDHEIYTTQSKAAHGGNVYFNFAGEYEEADAFMKSGETIHYKYIDESLKCYALVDDIEFVFSITKVYQNQIHELLSSFVLVQK